MKANCALVVPRSLENLRTISSGGIGVHRQYRAGVAARAADQNDLHRARQSVAEWLWGELPWAVPGRMFEPGTTVDLDGSAGVIGDYRGEYHQLRPHSKLDYESPVAFAARSCPKSQQQHKLKPCLRTNT